MVRTITSENWSQKMLSNSALFKSIATSSPVLFIGEGRREQGETVFSLHFLTNVPVKAFILHIPCQIEL